VNKFPPCAFVPWIRLQELPYFIKPMELLSRM
jgi:hypothetical protein